MAQMGDSDLQPLRGVVLCCTSLAQDVRIRIAQIASQMGAVHKLDLTSDVTHLLVGNIDTPKYRYVAKDRPDIRILYPDFIEAVRKAWMDGVELDVAHLEEKHTLPPFLGLQVCLTGFDDMAQRKHLENTLVENGAAYHGDLTKTVTHLIAATPQGAKYKHALQWKIHVVSLKWYEDCIIRGMAVDESLYNPQLPKEQQGVGAFRTVRKATDLGKRGREGEEGVATDETKRRKLRKVTSVRLDSQSQDMWRSISQAEVQVDHTEQDVWYDHDQGVPGAPPPPPMEKRDQSRPITPEQPQGLFSGHHILIHGFEAARAGKLRAVLSSNGGTIVQTADELESASHEANFRARCLLVPHDRRIALPDVPPGTLVVTEWWAERCLHYKKLLSSDSDPLSSPLTDVSVKGFQGLIISTTGLSGVDLRQTAEAVKLMGATYQEQLLPSTSVLVCATAAVKKEKAFYATKHNIPVVSISWLWDSLKCRTAASIDDHVVKLQALEPNELVGRSSIGTATHSPTLSLPVCEVTKPSERADEYMHHKRLSNMRKRHATPSLKLKASKANSNDRRQPKSGPFILPDGDDGQAPFSKDHTQNNSASPQPSSRERPLREISPNASQPRNDCGLGEKKSKELHTTGGIFQGPAVICEPVPMSSPKSSSKSPERSAPEQKIELAPLKAKDSLANDLASILQRRTSSNSARVAAEPVKGKHRPLGRNLSGTSIRSGSASASPALPAEPPESVSLADGFYVSGKEPTQPPPSTQLGYDDPEAHAHRVQMSKKMGTNLVEQGVRLITAATIKDSAGVATRSTRSGAGASRAKARNRGKA